MCKFIGTSNDRILCKLSKSEILRLYSVVHVAMETTKTSHFTCQSKSFISIFFTCQVFSLWAATFLLLWLGKWRTHKLPKLCSATLTYGHIHVTFEGKAKWFWSETSYIESIALHVHPKKSNHLRSYSRAIMAIDDSRLSQENKFLENKWGQIFCFWQVYFTKSCQQIWGYVNQPTFYTLHLMSNSTFYHTDHGQNAVFHNFSRHIALSQYSGWSIMGF